MRKLALFAFLAPAVAHAKKPAFYRPQTVDSEQQAQLGAAKLAAGIKTKSAAGISDVLGTQFSNNGMWFPDAACAKKFGPGGDVKGADVALFARCLTGFKVQLSTRRSGLRDGAVLTVDPGIEIELLFSGEKLRWIGFPSQQSFDRAIPMLTAQAFEGLRKAGSAVVDDKVRAALDLELAKQRVSALTSWVKTCLDPAGEVVKTTVVTESTGATSDAFRAAIADWKFAPFKAGGTPTAACAMTLLVYPGTRAPAVEAYPTTNEPIGSVTRTYDFDDDDLELFAPTPQLQPPPPVSPINVPPTLLEQLRITGTKNVAPDGQTKRDMIAAGKTKVIASLKMCLDDRGQVTTATLLKSSGFPAYDRRIQLEMRRWIYKPYKMNGNPTAVCTAVTFIYDVSTRAP